MPLLARDFMAPDAATQLRAAVEALRRGSTYPERAQHVEAIETHMSWVFLTERYAYKLKKPIRTPLLDHATPEARARACQNELTLNRRLAPDVYLGVLPLTAAASGWQVAGEGEVLDWLIHMRRLPRERMLDACIARGSVTADEVDRLLERLTEFYAHTERLPLAGPEYVQRLHTDIEAKHASLVQPRYRLSVTAIDALAQRQLRWLELRRSVIEARASAIVDAHGDLRPEHVCLEPRPVVIDCLEFARSLRSLDPISELSFLALECRRLGAAWIGERLLAGYAAPELAAFYQSYHALVRAAVAIWHLDDGGVPRVDGFRDRAARYLELGASLCPDVQSSSVSEPSVCSR